MAESAERSVCMQWHNPRGSLENEGEMGPLRRHTTRPRTILKQVATGGHRRNEGHSGDRHVLGRERGERRFRAGWFERRKVRRQPLRRSHTRWKDTLTACAHQKFCDPCPDRSDVPSGHRPLRMEGPETQSGKSAEPFDQGRLLFAGHRASAGGGC